MTPRHLRWVWARRDKFGAVLAIVGALSVLILLRIETHRLAPPALTDEQRSDRRAWQAAAFKKVMGDERNVGLIGNAERASAFRPIPMESPPLWRGFELLESSRVAIPSGDLEKLKRLLTDPACIGGHNFCDSFDPGLYIRFELGEDRLTLAFCFQCDDLMSDGPGAEDKMMFTPIRPHLLGMAKRCYPDDEEIQGID